MKKGLFLAICLMMAVFSNLTAEEIVDVSTIGTGSTTPFRFDDANQTIHFQMIMPKSLFNYQATKEDYNCTYKYQSIKGIKLYVPSTCTLPQNTSLGFKLEVTIWQDPDNSSTKKDEFTGNDDSFFTRPTDNSENPTLYKILYSNMGSSTIGGALTLDNTHHTIEIPGTPSNYFEFDDNKGNLILDVQMSSGADMTNDLNFTGDASTNKKSVLVENDFLSATKYAKCFFLKTTFDCKRNIQLRRENTNINKSDFDIVTGESPHATLIKYRTDENATNYSITCSTIRVPAERPTDVKTFSVYDVGSYCNFGGNSYQITTIGNNKPFNAVNKSTNTAYILPQFLSTIGIDGQTNECFYTTKADLGEETANNSEVFFILTKNEYPTIVGKNLTSSTVDGNDPDPIINANGPKTHLYFRYNVTGTLPDCWSQNIKDKFTGGFGYCSYLYNISFQSDPNLKDLGHSRQVQGSLFNQIVSIQYPYSAVYPLEITLHPTVEDKNYDGTVHFYNGFLTPTDDSTVPGMGTVSYTITDGIPKLSCTQEGDCESFSVISQYDAHLRYMENNDAARDASELNGVYNKFLENCNKLVFKYNASEGVSSPEWKYTNSKNNTSVAGAPNYLTSTVPVYVERTINNSQYSFYSMPFDCKVSDIGVKYLTTSGNWTRNQYDIVYYIAKDFTSDYSENDDRFVIYEYIGQENTAADDYKAKYRQVGSTETLYANKGYAFALIESNTNYNKAYPSDYQGDAPKITASAIITFKHTDNDNNNSEKRFYINTFGEIASTGFEYVPTSDGNTSTDDHIFRKILISSGVNNRNKNWNLVGNPFYHSIMAAAFGKYVTVIGEGANNNVVHRSTIADAQNATIHPFQTFFIQAMDDDGGLASIHIDPTAQNYSTPQAAPSATTLITRQEVVSVNLLQSDSLVDFTAVIDDATRTEDYEIGNDLAKMMNPGAQIFTFYDNVYCAFKEIPLREDSTRAIPLGIRITEDGTYKFSLDTTRNYFYGAVMLHDKQYNLFYPLTDDGVEFELTAGTDVARFELLVVPSELPSEIENVETSKTLDAYVHDGRLVVNNIEDGSMLSIYDISGKMIYSAPATDEFNYQFYAHGVYMVVLRGKTTGSIKVVY